MLHGRWTTCSLIFFSFISIYFFFVLETFFFFFELFFKRVAFHCDLSFLLSIGRRQWSTMTQEFGQLNGRHSVDDCIQFVSRDKREFRT